MRASNRWGGGGARGAASGRRDRAPAAPAGAAPPAAVPLVDQPPPPRRPQLHGRAGAIELVVQPLRRASADFRAVPARTTRARNLAQARARRRQSSGTVSSAACDGVAARASATKSAMVKSTSCPTALTTGTRAGGDGARQRLVVEGRQSSAEPPPRPPGSPCPRAARRASARTMIARRAVALHLARRQEELHARPPLGDAHHVAHRRPRR